MIRSANESDCINLAALSLEVWLQTYAVDGINSNISQYALATFTEQHFKEYLHNKKYQLLVSIEDNYLRGYALVNFDSTSQLGDHGFEIEKLYVHSAFQGRAIGRSLLQEVEMQYGVKFWLYTWVRNESIGFYKKYGFEDIGQYDFEFGNEIIENRVLAYSSDQK